MFSKHVEAWNKLIIKFSATSWLILMNKYIEMHGQQYIKYKRSREWGLNLEPFRIRRSVILKPRPQFQWACLHTKASSTCRYFYRYVPGEVNFVWGVTLRMFWVLIWLLETEDGGTTICETSETTRHHSPQDFICNQAAVMTASVV